MQSLMAEYLFEGKDPTQNMCIPDVDELTRGEDVSWLMLVSAFMTSCLAL